MARQRDCRVGVVCLADLARAWLGPVINNALPSRSLIGNPTYVRRTGTPWKTSVAIDRRA